MGFKLGTVKDFYETIIENVAGFSKNPLQLLESPIEFLH